MITSIRVVKHTGTINYEKVIPGSNVLESSFPVVSMTSDISDSSSSVDFEGAVSVKAYNNTVSIGIDNSSLKYTSARQRYYNNLETLSGGVLPVNNFPYVTSIDTVRPDVYGNLWMVGSKTFDVSQYPEDSSSSSAENGIYVCDMGETIRYDQIYSNTYRMLQQIRRWYDGIKDSLLLFDDQDQKWADMLMEDYSYSDSESGSYSGSEEYFMDVRGRNQIAALKSSRTTGILNEYKSLVFLWNYILKNSLSHTDADTHPVNLGAAYLINTDHIDCCSYPYWVASYVINMKPDDASYLNARKIWVRLAETTSSPIDAKISAYVNYPSAENSDSESYSMSDACIPDGIVIDVSRYDYTQDHIQIKLILTGTYDPANPDRREYVPKDTLEDTWTKLPPAATCKCYTPQSVINLSGESFPVLTASDGYDTRVVLNLLPFPARYHSYFESFASSKGYGVDGAVLWTITGRTDKFLQTGMTRTSDGFQMKTVQIKTAQVDPITS